MAATLPTSMAVKGVRFDIPIDEDDFQEQPSPADGSSLFGTDFVKDIQERQPSTSIKPPAPPQLSSSAATGFPERRKRKAGLSRFKAQQQTEDAAPVTGTSTNGNNEDIVKREIDRENNEKIASMTEDEIEQERQSLLNGLPPSLIEKFLRKANLDDPVERAPSTADDSKTTKDSKIKEAQEGVTVLEKPTLSSNYDPDDAPKTMPSDLRPAHEPPAPFQYKPPSHLRESTTQASYPPSSASQAPSLDPSDPSFFKDLHQKYFPNLSHDPSKLSWMTPLPDSNTTLPTSLSPSEIRFSFTGTIIPPSSSSSYPSHLGLHHHAHDPSSAGYTIPELGMLSRSAVPAQRTMSYLVLGRILYRLGRGEFGFSGQSGLVATVDEGDTGAESDLTDLRDGLDALVKRERVIDVLQWEADPSKDDGASQPFHRSARAHAVEALWLWQRGLQEGKEKEEKLREKLAAIKDDA